MANLLVSAVGATIGFFVGGPAGAQAGWAVGSLLGSALVKGPNQQGPRLGDLRVQGSEYGAAIPWVASSPRFAGQIAWSSLKREIPNTEKVGKGGGQKVTTFTYEVDLLIVLTENPIAGILRIFSNSELVYDATVPSTKAGVWNSLSIYLGDGDQLPDPTYEAAVGVGNAPAYRGRGYVVINGLQLGNGGAIPNLTFETASITNATILNDFQDYSLNEWTVLDDYAGTPATIGFLGCDESIKKIGAASGVFSGNFITPKQGLVIDMDDSALQMGDEEWTVEAWMKATQPDYSGSRGTFFSAGLSNGTANGVFFNFNEFGVFGATIRRDAAGGFNFFPASAAAIYPLDDWFHVAAQRSGDNIQGFINGTLVFDEPFPTVLTSIVNTEQMEIGGNKVGQPNWNGFIDEFIYSKGVARYPTSFTPPVTQHVPDAFTVAYVPFNTPQRLGRGLTSLREVVDALMLRAGYAADEFDTSDLAAITKPVRGMAIGQITNTRAVLETLQTAFFFESAKSDKVYFRQRPITPIADIPFEELGAAPDAVNDQDPLSLIVGNELEVPAQISLSYPNVAADYNVGTEHSDRLLSGQESNQTVQLGLGMLPAEAKGVADALLIDQIASLTRTTVRVPLKYAYIEPGDVYTVTNRDGRQYRIRCQTKRDTLTILENETVLDDVGALTSAEITSDNYALTETVRVIAPTLWEVMDMPILRDADNQAGFYFAITPDREAPEDEWPGAVAVRSWSADAFEQLFISGDACVMGDCTTTLGDFEGGSGRFDEGTTLTVRVFGELASTTRADMLDDLSLNAALVGSEILRFRLAELLGTVDGQNEYRLSGFVRGQRGTEQHIGTHVAAERFVLLNVSLRRVLNQNSEIGVPSEVKAVTLNTLLSAVPPEDFTDTGVALKPFSVAGLRALAVGADIVLTWNRRTRLSYRYGGSVGASVPLGEATEAYRIDVYNGPTLVDTYTSTDSTYTYLDADITSDGFGSADVITFVVRQLSEIVGPGFPATVQGIAP